MDLHEAASEAAEFGGRLILALIGGLAVLALVLALVLVAWQSNQGHRKVQRAQPRPPGVELRIRPPAPHA